MSLRVFVYFAGLALQILGEFTVFVGMILWAFFQIEASRITIMLGISEMLLGYFVKTRSKPLSKE